MNSSKLSSASSIISPNYFNIIKNLGHLKWFTNEYALYNKTYLGCLVNPCLKF